MKNILFWPFNFKWLYNTWTFPIDFKQKPILIQSFNERSVIENENKNWFNFLSSLFRVFLLLCNLQQSVHLYEGGSTLHPYLLYWSRNLCCTKSKMLVTNNNWANRFCKEKKFTGFCFLVLAWKLSQQFILMKKEFIIIRQK